VLQYFNERWEAAHEEAAVDISSHRLVALQQRVREAVDASESERRESAAAAAATCLHDKHEDPEIELFALDQQRPVDVATKNFVTMMTITPAAIMQKPTQIQLSCLQATERRASCTAAAALGKMRMSLLPPLLVGLQITAAWIEAREAMSSAGSRSADPLCPWRLQSTRCAAEVVKGFKCH
jgi:hypothetical protein